MGRPKKPEKAKKTESIRLYFSPEEIAVIRQLARDAYFGEDAANWLMCQIRRVVAEARGDAGK